MKRHKLLERQIKKYLAASTADLTTQQKEGLEVFLSKVNQAYEDFERDRLLLEKSMELSSQELFKANREMQQKNLELQTIHKVDMIVQTTDDLDKVYDKITEEIASAISFPVIVLEMYQKEDKQLSLASCRGVPAPIQSLYKANIGSSSPSINTLERGLSQCLWISAEQKKFNNEFWSQLKLDTLLSIPLRVNDEPLGVLSIGHYDPEVSHPFWLVAIANQIALNIDSKKLALTLQMQKMNMMAASKMSELGKMAGGIAHEINNPLAIINMKAGQLSDLCQEPEIDRKMVISLVGKIEDTVDRVAKIISGLRTFSRESSADAFEKTNLFQLVDETLVFCSERLKRHSIQIKIDIPQDIFIDCRAVQISQVILNLLNNASDAIEALPEKWIHIEALDKKDQIQILVTDSGPGISADVKEKLFRPFFTTKDVGKGTGLGLSVALGIIKGHNGSLRLNEKSKNTNFIIELNKNLNQKDMKAA